MLDSTLSTCEKFLFDHLLPNWSEHGIDAEQGYSYESLNHDWSRNSVGRLRLLTQCRQLYTFSHACKLKEDSPWRDKLMPLFEFIISHYYLDDRWIFSLNDDLTVKDEQSDAYALAFVLLSFSHYYQLSGDQRALSYMKQTHQFLMANMQAKAGGFYEAYPVDLTQVRRQNPHMHLLEGYIAAYQASQDAQYKQSIEFLLSLAHEHFYDKNSRTLREFFTNDWQIHPEIGHQVEPGHHFEWVWLLYQAYQICPDPVHLELAQQLFSTGTRHGMSEDGGIYNQIDANTYVPLDEEKRIWPITEYLKAITVMPIGKEEKQLRLAKALEFMQQHYLLEDGRWNEYLDKENNAKDFPLPGTSSYHIFLGLVEVLTWQQSN